MPGTCDAILPVASRIPVRASGRIRDHGRNRCSAREKLRHTRIPRASAPTSRKQRIGYLQGFLCGSDEARRNIVHRDLTRLAKCGEYFANGYCAGYATAQASPNEVKAVRKAARLEMRDAIAGRKP